MQNQKALCTTNIFFSYPTFYDMDKWLCLTVLPNKIRWAFYYAHFLVGSLFLLREFLKKCASVNNCKNTFSYIFRQILRMIFVCHLHDISQANETAEPEISVMTSPEKQPEPGWDITPHYRFAQAFESPSSMTQWAECGGGKRSPSPLVSR